MSKQDDYKKLKDTWYKKLKKSGFNDIEDDLGRLKSYHSTVYTRKRNLEIIEKKAHYYELATAFLNEFTFANKVEEIIWEYHSNGIDARSIAKLLKQTRVWKTNRQTVWLMIKRLERAMKYRYLPDFKDTDD